MSAVWCLAVSILLGPSLAVVVFRATSIEAQERRARIRAAAQRRRRNERRWTRDTFPILTEETP